MTDESSPVSLVVSVSEAMLLLRFLDYLQNCVYVNGLYPIKHVGSSLAH